MALLRRCAAVLVVILATCRIQQASGECTETFMDALGGGDLWLMRQGLELTGFADKLPSPDIGVTILVPNNGAWWNLFWRNGLFLRQLSSLGDKLTGVVTFHVIPSALTPETLNGPEGSVPTLYGLLTGQPANLKHWLKFDGEQYLFQGPWDDTVAGVVDVRQVCNSWVYVVDEVLKPAYDLSDVLKVEIPELPPLGSSPSPSLAPSPSPSPAPSPPQSAPVPANQTPSAPVLSTPSPPTCDKTFAQVAGETSGLTVLKTMLSQQQFASVLPSPAGDYTLFAPTDNAFLSFLSTFGLSINDALALGDRLNSVLLYHVAPGALSPEQLAAETTLTTGLAIKTENIDFTLSVSAASGNTTVSGIYPGNTANLISDLSVCASRVYVIDRLLIPAATLDAIPGTTGGLPPPAASPPPAPRAPTAAPAPSPAAPPVTTIDGVALATGYLANCSLSLSISNQTATTDASGRFTFDCGSSCADLGAVVTLAAVGQTAGCVDSLTGLPPPFDLRAPVTALPEGATLAALSPLTTITAAAAMQQQQGLSSSPAGLAASRKMDAPTGTVNRKLLADPPAAAEPELAPEAASAPLSAVPAPAPAPALPVVPSFGITEDAGSAAGTSYGDALAAALGGDQAAYNLLSKNQDLVCTGSISDALLVTLVGGNSTAKAAGAAALFDELAKDLLAGSPFNLSDPTSLLGLLDRSLTELTAAAADASPPPTDKATVMQAATDTMVLMNSLLQQAVATAQENQLAEASKMAEVLARLAIVCQVNVAPAASQLAAGTLSIDAWKQQFSLEAIKSLAISANAA